MKELLVLSGKGGTGKTTIVASFAVLADNKVLVDCDVDASDLPILLQHDLRESHGYQGARKARVNADKCSACGRCVKACRFEALSLHNRRAIIDALSCEGCGVCHHICPNKAIHMENSQAGQWFVSDTLGGKMVHARLEPGEENSGKLIASIREHAKKLAQKVDAEHIISDGPPGIGCPVISSVSGADVALVITEPTVSGRHDLERTVQLLRHFAVPTLVCINKYDLDENLNDETGAFCRAEGLEVVGKIPFDERVIKALTKAVPIVQMEQEQAGPAALAIRSLWDEVHARLAQ